MDILYTDLQIRAGNQCYDKYRFSYFSTNTYVMGAQMTHLNETVLLNIQRMDKKILSLYLAMKYFAQIILTCGYIRAWLLCGICMQGKEKRL